MCSRNPGFSRRAGDRLGCAGWRSWWRWRKWELGLELLRLLDPSPDAQPRRDGARFCHAYAARLCATGLVDDAGDHVARASHLWPAQRLAMIDDPALRDVWKVDGEATNWRRIDLRLEREQSFIRASVPEDSPPTWFAVVLGVLVAGAGAAPTTRRHQHDTPFMPRGDIHEVPLGTVTTHG
jgi:hypothetical protein